MEALLLSIEDAGHALGIKRTAVYRLVDDGELNRVKVGRRALITAASVHEFATRVIESARQEADAS